MARFLAVAAGWSTTAPRQRDARHAAADLYGTEAAELAARGAGLDRWPAMMPGGLAAA
ncbi:hypothetical protein ACU4GD_08250 [Cupriavidus basilensis]